jgi:predicted amidophosphoribosyltransferase
LIAHHPFLKETDEVYYLGEFTNGKRADHSPMNRQIFNYKKELKWEGKQSWEYKEFAIKDVAKSFRTLILQTSEFPERIKKALLVPIPPHIAKGDPGYDDRNLKMLNYFVPKGNIHELILQKESREALHESNKRDIKKLEHNYILNAPKQNIEFNEIWLFDDVLRHGTHFRAIHNLLERSYPNVKIVGFFIARSIQYLPTFGTELGPPLPF